MVQDKKSGSGKWVRAVEYAVVLSLLAVVYYKAFADPTTCSCGVAGNTAANTAASTSTGALRTGASSAGGSESSNPLPSSATTADLIAEVNTLKGEISALLVDMSGAQTGVSTANSAIDAVTVRVAVLEATDSIPGPRGLDGIDGAPGPRGPRGYRGVEGERGSNGARGSTGDEGAAGANGYCAVFDPATGQESLVGCQQAEGDAADSASVLKLKGIVESLMRVSIINQMQREQRVRYEGGSGLTQVRAYMGGSRAYYSPAYSNGGFANIHNHPDWRDSIGMGEIAAVLNGVEFWTRHNDYILRQPHATSTEYHATQDIVQPRVPPAVLAKAAGCGDGLCIADQAEEMRRWFHAWQDQDPACPSCQALDAARVARGEAAFDAPGTLRDYRPFFRPVLSYLEGGWINAQDGLEEPFKSERHHIEAKTWRELYDKNRFLYQSGRKNTLENLPFLPQIVRGTRNNGSEPIIANWEYRIMVAPLREDIKLNRFKVSPDLWLQMLGSGNGPMTLRELYYNRRSRFQLNHRDEDRFFEGRQAFSFIDQLMEQIPGKNNYVGAADLRDTAFGINATHYLRPSEQLQAGYYSRFFTMAGNDAMGRTQHRRSFNDPNMWAAMTTQPKVSGIGACSSDILGTGDNTQCSSALDEFEQKWTWALPLEVIYLTPLHNWNPYNIEICRTCDPTSNPGGPPRNGGFEQNRAWSSAKHNVYFYFTPVEFFTPTADIEKDPADTDRGAVGVLDRRGVVRKVRASGHWIFFPRVTGFKDPIRQRYPIMPIHEEGKTAWKEIKALQDIVFKTYGTNADNIGQVNNVQEAEEERSGVSLRLAFTAGPAGAHDHTISLSGSDIVDLNEKGQVSAGTSLANGHTHTVVVTRTGTYNSDGRRTHTYQLLQCDEKLRQPDGSYNVRKCAGAVDQPAFQANLTGAIQRLNPWGYYTSPDTDLVDYGNLTGIWRESSGNGRDCAITYPRNEGPPVALSVPPERPALRVAKFHKLRFPAGSIPTQFTIIVRARYTGGTMDRIFTSVEKPFWFLGWTGGKVGPTSFDKFMTNSNLAAQPATGWYTFAGRNSATGTTVWQDGASVSIRNDGAGGLSLASNVHRAGDAEISDVVIFDRHLTDAEVDAVSSGFVNMPAVPMPCCWDGHKGVKVITL